MVGSRTSIHRCIYVCLCFCWFRPTTNEELTNNQTRFPCQAMINYTRSTQLIYLTAGGLTMATIHVEESDERRRVFVGSWECWLLESLYGWISANYVVAWNAVMAGVNAANRMKTNAAKLAWMDHHVCSMGGGYGREKCRVKLYRWHMFSILAYFTVTIRRWCRFIAC